MDGEPCSCSLLLHKYTIFHIGATMKWLSLSRMGNICLASQNQHILKYRMQSCHEPFPGAPSACRACTLCHVCHLRNLLGQPPLCEIICIERVTYPQLPSDQVAQEEKQWGNFTFRVRGCLARDSLYMRVWQLISCGGLRKMECMRV